MPVLLKRFCTSNNLPPRCDRRRRRERGAARRLRVRPIYGVFHVFHSKAFLARPAAFFLATPAAFLRIPRLTAFLMESTRSLGVSQGSIPASSEKGNSCANSALLGWGVNLSFFLALGVMWGLGGTGGFLGPRVGVYQTNSISSHYG